MAQKKSSEGVKETRTRTWTIVVYPDSAPENWRDLIDEEHIGWVESPLHEFDTNPTGEVKKAHWHVLLCFGSVKAYEQVVEFVKPLNCPIPKRVHDAKAMVRYMAHLDNPDKFQYSVSEIIPHGGVDLAELLRPSASERYTIIAEMIDWCKDNSISEFQDLMDEARANSLDRWFPLLCDSASLVMREYIKSSRHRHQKNRDN